MLLINLVCMFMMKKKEASPGVLSPLNGQMRLEIFMESQFSIVIEKMELPASYLIML